MLAILLRTIGMAMPSFLISTLIFTIFMNISLAIFNLIPIHPLDGGKIVIGILPPETGRELDLFLHRCGFIILIFLIFPFGNSQSPVNYLIRPIISGIANFCCRCKTTHESTSNKRQSSKHFMATGE